MSVRRRLICALVPSLHVAIAVAQVPVSDAVFTRDVYPETRAAFPGGVVGLRDVTYATNSGFRPLKLDLYLPPGPTTGRRPTIVYMHGGGWAGGTPKTTGAFENWPQVLASFAARGYVVASVSYRLSGEAPFPAAIQDVKSAIRWLKTNAATYGVDTDRMMTWGVSAGGQLAGLAALSCGAADLEPAVGGRGGRGGARGDAAAATPAPAPPSTCVQGGVLWYSASSFENALRPSETPARNPYLNCTPPSCTSEARQATVHTYVDAKDPPILLIHGTADTTVPVAQSQTLYDALKAAGVKTEILLFPDIGHSFIGKTGEATRAASRAALEKTIVFIDSLMGKK